MHIYTIILFKIITIYYAFQQKLPTNTVSRREEAFLTLVLREIFLSNVNDHLTIKISILNPPDWRLNNIEGFP